MQVRDFLGITLAECDVDEATSTDWTALGTVDVVRVVAPPAHTWQALERAGFVCKPDRVTWVAPTEDSDDAFRSRLSLKDRQNLRSAERRVAAAGLRMETVQPVDERVLDPFLELYAAQVRGMRHGLEVAVTEREAILSDAAYFAVVVRDRDGEVAGGCLCHEPRGDDALVRVRFSAVSPDHRDLSLTRPLYLRAVGVARERGYAHVTLGNDPNLYGHIPKPGLYSFKARLGFAPIAPRLYGPSDSCDQADLVLRLSALTDPALVLGYLVQDGDGGEPVRLRLEVITTDPDPDLRPFALALDTEPRVRRPALAARPSAPDAQVVSPGV